MNSVKYSVVLCLALMSGTIALAQQPAEWHPSIGEDNKAATWEETSTFIINSLANFSGTPLNPTSPSRCQIAVTVKAANDPVGITVQNFDQHSLQIVSVRAGSFAESIGMENGMRLIGVEVNGKVKLDFQRHNDRMVDDFQSLESTFSVGDRLVFVVKSEHFNAKINTKYLPRGYGNAVGILTIPEGVYAIDLTKVDPLTVVVRGAKTVSFSGSMNGIFASTPSDKDGKTLTSTQPINLPMTGTEVAQRTARALLHAALLCGGAKAVSPF